MWANLIVLNDWVHRYNIDRVTFMVPIRITKFSLIMRRRIVVSSL